MSTHTDNDLFEGPSDESKDPTSPSNQPSPIVYPPGSIPRTVAQDADEPGDPHANLQPKNLSNNDEFNISSSKRSGIHTADAQEEGALPPLVNLSSGSSFLQAQRRDSPAMSISEQTNQLVNSVFTTDCYEWTDFNLISWFRKNQSISNGDAPFFNTAALSKLMMKENLDLKQTVATFQKTFSGLDDLRRHTSLVALTEAVFHHYQPSAPTIIKLCIFWLVEKGTQSDDCFNGLDSSASILSLVTAFIENYYQVPTHRLSIFETSEVRSGTYKIRAPLNGKYEDQPGYVRLTAKRSVFEAEASAKAYINTWSTLWSMLKLTLCSGVEFVPDVDLATRRRVVNGLKTHPLRQQFTHLGLEAARLWLSRYSKADEAGLAFEKQAGFSCGMVFDDNGHISIAMDCMHEALFETFNLVLMQSEVKTKAVPRIIPELKIFERNRRLPACTWERFCEVFTLSYDTYVDLLVKKSYPITRPVRITSNLEIKQSGADGEGGSDPSCRWCSGGHFTCDCTSNERKNAGSCNNFAKGKCKKGKNCRYLHAKNSQQTHVSLDKSGLNTQGDSLSSQDQVTGTSKKSQPDADALVTDSPETRSKPEPDDFSKAQTRVCSYKECGKTFTIPLEGDKGTQWYSLRGLFLPKRCEECIAAGKKNWTSSQHKPKESQLTQNGSGLDMEDPEAVDSLVVCLAPALIHGPFTNELGFCSDADSVDSGDASYDPQSYAVAHEFSDPATMFDHLLLINQVSPLTTETLMADHNGDCEPTAGEDTGVPGRPTESRPLISPSEIHDCLLEVWGGLLVDPAAFDSARMCIHAYMVTGYCATDGSIMRWNGRPIPLNDDEAAEVFRLLCDESCSPGLTCDHPELCHGFVEVIHVLSLTRSTLILSDFSDVDSDESSSTASSDSDADHAAWELRMNDRHSLVPQPASPPESDPDARPARNRTQTAFYVPSPSGFVREVLSPNEFCAAVSDSDLDDASIKSADLTSSSSDSELSAEPCDYPMEVDFSLGADLADLAGVVIYNDYCLLGGTLTPHFLPTIIIEDTETAIEASIRLASDMYIDLPSQCHHGYPLAITNVVMDPAIDDPHTAQTVIRIFAIRLANGDDHIPVMNAVRELWDCGDSLQWYSPAAFRSLNTPFSNAALAGLTLVYPGINMQLDPRISTLVADCLPYRSSDSAMEISSAHANRICKCVNCTLAWRALAEVTDASADFADAVKTLSSAEEAEKIRRLCSSSECAEAIVLWRGLSNNSAAPAPQSTPPSNTTAPAPPRPDYCMDCSKQPRTMASDAAQTPESPPDIPSGLGYSVHDATDAFHSMKIDDYFKPCKQSLLVDSDAEMDTERYSECSQSCPNRCDEDRVMRCLRRMQSALSNTQDISRNFPCQTTTDRVRQHSQSWWPTGPAPWKLHPIFSCSEPCEVTHICSSADCDTSDSDMPELESVPHIGLVSVDSDVLPLERRTVPYLPYLVRRTVEIVMLQQTVHQHPVAQQEHQAVPYLASLVNNWMTSALGFTDTGLDYMGLHQMYSDYHPSFRMRIRRMLLVRQRIYMTGLVQTWRSTLWSQHQLPIYIDIANDPYAPVWFDEDMPDLVSDNSFDSWSDEFSSDDDEIPIHTRADVDSDLDDSITHSQSGYITNEVVTGPCTRFDTTVVIGSFELLEVQADDQSDSEDDEDFYNPPAELHPQAMSASDVISLLAADEVLCNHQGTPEFTSDAQAATADRRNAAEDLHAALNVAEEVVAGGDDYTAQLTLMVEERRVTAMNMYYASLMCDLMLFTRLTHSLNMRNRMVAVWVLNSRSVLSSHYTCALRDAMLSTQGHQSLQLAMETWLQNFQYMSQRLSMDVQLIPDLDITRITSITNALPVRLATCLNYHGLAASAITAVCDWIFNGSQTYYSVRRPASMGWYVGRQKFNTWDGYWYFINCIIRRLSTASASAIATLFNARPIGCAYLWYYASPRYSAGHHPAVRRLMTETIGNQLTYPVDPLGTTTSTLTAANRACFWWFATRWKQFKRALSKYDSCSGDLKIVWTNDHSDDDPPARGQNQPPAGPSNTTTAACRSTASRSPTNTSAAPVNGNPTKRLLIDHRQLNDANKHNKLPDDWFLPPMQCAGLPQTAADFGACYSPSEESIRTVDESISGCSPEDESLDITRLLESSENSAKIHCPIESTPQRSPTTVSTPTCSRPLSADKRHQRSVDHQLSVFEWSVFDSHDHPDIHTPGFRGSQNPLTYCIDASSLEHSLLTAANANREFLAHAVFVDNTSSKADVPCSQWKQICALWDSASNTCLISPRIVKSHWQWVSRNAEEVVGVGGRSTTSRGIVMVPLQLVHSGKVKLVCCTVIDFHKIIDILFGLDYQFTHACIFDPSNFRVYDRLSKETVRLDYINKVKARLMSPPIHFLSICGGMDPAFGMALNMGFRVAKYFSYEKYDLVRQVAAAIYPDIVHLEPHDFMLVKDFSVLITMLLAQGITRLCFTTGFPCTPWSRLSNNPPGFAHPLAQLVIRGGELLALLRKSGILWTVLNETVGGGLRS